jgi:hypothetical protein
MSSHQRLQARMAAIAALLLLPVAVASAAESYSLERWVVAGGGGGGGGAAYAVHGTIGQASAGLASKGLYALYGGYWFRETVVQRSDCNGDHAIDAGDLSALVLEVFDADGQYAGDTGGGSFGGDGVGCDANADGIVNAGDVACIVLTVFNGLGACH